MPTLSRRRSKDDPHREVWLIYFGDVRVATIGRRSGVPNSAPQWAWSCGFYPGMDAGEQRSGIAETFDAARDGFQVAWQEIAPTCTEVHYEAWRLRPRLDEMEIPHALWGFHWLGIARELHVCAAA